VGEARLPRASGPEASENGGKQPVQNGDFESIKTNAKSMWFFSL